MKTVKLDQETAEVLIWLDPGDSAGPEGDHRIAEPKWAVVEHVVATHPSDRGYYEVMTVVRDRHGVGEAQHYAFHHYHHQAFENDELLDIDLNAHPVVKEQRMVSTWVPVK